MGARSFGSFRYNASKAIPHCMNWPGRALSGSCTGQEVQSPCNRPPLLVWPDQGVCRLGKEGVLCSIGGSLMVSGLRRERAPCTCPPLHRVV